MCLAKVYMVKEEDKPIMKDIAYLTINEDRVEVETLFGEKRVFKGKVRQIDFVKSGVELEKTQFF